MLANIYRPHKQTIRVRAVMHTLDEVEKQPEFIPFKLMLYGFSCHVQNMTRAIMTYVTRTAPYNKVGTVKYIVNKLHNVFEQVSDKELQFIPEHMCDAYDRCGALIATSIRPDEWAMHEEYARINPDAKDQYIVALIDTALTLGYTYANSIEDAVNEVKPQYNQVTQRLLRNITMFTSQIEELRRIVLGTMAYKTQYVVRRIDVPYTKRINEILNHIATIADGDELWHEINTILENE